MISRKAAFLSCLLLVGVFACSRDQEGSPPASEPEAAVDSVTETFQGRVFERDIVFLSARIDSMLLVPWLMSARTVPGGVRREARGLLGRADAWEAFFSDTWETPPTRVPWRVVPRGQMRLVVGDNDVIQEIIFDEGPRQLEVALENQSPLAEWAGQQGETVRLLNGSLVLTSTRVPGLIMDLTRGRQAREGAGGDWAFLVDGDSLRLVLQAPQFLEPGAPGAFRAWALMGEQELDWPSVTVTWTETRAFERARREVPVKLTATSSTNDLRIDLEVRTAEVQAGEGEGPQLPVDAVFEVEGTVRMGDDSYPVKGLLRHIQP
jgi:hypothetical protein